MKLWILLFLATPIFAQDLKEFLSLTDRQLSAIYTNNEEYNRTSLRRQERMAQVYRELAEETAREPLDPLAIGMRYAEIETHCRALKEEADRVRRLNIAVLTEAQRTRLALLDEALKLVNTGYQARFTGLLANPGSAPAYLNSTSTITGGAVFGGIATPGCQLPFLPPS